MFNIETIKSALVSTVLMAILSVAGYILQLGDVFKVDLHTLTNVAVISFLTGIVSVLKNLLTNEEGRFVGIVKLK